jgi:Ras-related protein Rab-32
MEWGLYGWQKVRLPNGDRLPLVLLANKCDLAKQAISPEIMDAFCREHGFLTWFATSARDNINITKAVDFMVDHLYRTSGSSDSLQLPPISDSVCLSSHRAPSRSPRTSSCC